ncbi:MAG: ABC transporter ATP-binding protein/permease [Oscillospiraceae bacterium]|nr:ABC transporter ATP-binding protein/permease [Oscillospiraceae bacterium]
MNENEYPSNFSFAVWKKILPFARPMGGRLVLVVLLLTVNALIDIAYPLMLRHILNNHVVTGDAAGLRAVIALYAALVVIQVFTVYMFIRLALFCEFTIARELRGAVFKRLQILPISYYSQTPVGYIMARCLSDTANIGDRIVWGIVDMSWGAAYMVFAIVTMFALNWTLALIMVAFMAVLSCVTYWFQKRILKMNREVRKRNSIMTGAMNEGITAARTTKTLVMENQSLEEFKGVTGAMKLVSSRIALLRSIYGPTVFFAGGLAVAAVLTAGGMLTLQGALALGTLAAFISYSFEISHQISHLAHVLPEFVASQANVERVTAMLERQPEIIETPEALERYGGNFDPKTENWEPLLGDVEFSDVTFMYPDGTVNVLEHFNLSVPRGSMVAIVGETGAGKSTLVNLVCRFFEPTGGRVLIDGRDIRDRTQLWLHSHLGYVLQDPHLFSGSVTENIRYGRLEATDEEVRAAARAVGADAFIEKLGGGWDADVGEGGGRLSTGQKQLVSLARAILADPRIFILDEATSSVDTEAERLIQRAVAVALKGRTSFVIAHRLSTIRAADMILVVDQGRIIERGSHETLMAGRGHYHDLYVRQFAAAE